MAAQLSPELLEWSGSASYNSSVASLTRSSCDGRIRGRVVGTGLARRRDYERTNNLGRRRWSVLVEFASRRCLGSED